MISITRLTQAKNNLELDLKRVYETAYKNIESEDNPDEFWAPFNLTEEEWLEQFIKENYDENLTDEELNELKDKERNSAYWKATFRYYQLMKRISRYLKPFPKAGAATVTLLYDFFVHPILFSNWHWNDYDDIESLGLNLSSDEVYDGLKNCNPDVVSVFLSKLENCSIADRELLQEAYSNAQKDVFVNKLKTISIKDYNRLVSVTAFSHYENALISLDIDTLRILFYHIDFGEDFTLDLSLMIDEDLFELKGEEYWKQIFPNDDASEEEWIAAINISCDKIESYKDHLVRVFYSTLKYLIPKIFEAFKPFPFERKYLDDVLSIPEVKSILDELPENPEESNIAPDDQEQPEPQPLIVQPVGQKPEDEGKPNDTEYVPHWPTDEELADYDENLNDTEYFTECVFGLAKSVKASEVEELYNVLVSKNVGVLDETLETKLIFLARYSGKKIPGLDLKPLKWSYNASDRDKALGYLIKTTAKAKYAKGIRFFYYTDNDKDIKPEREPVSQGGNAWALVGRQETTRTLFEKELNRFLEAHNGHKN